MYSQDNPILQLYKQPLHKEIIKNPTFERTEVNRSCGDSITLFVSLDSSTQRVSQVSFQGDGCSLSLSSAELLCRLVSGKTESEAASLAHSFLDFLKSDPSVPMPNHLPREFGYYNDLRSFPMRQKCAAMAWEILVSVFSSESDP